MNIHLLLQMAADGMGDRPAFQVDECALGYAELARLVAGAGGWIARKSVDRVAYLGVNGAAFPLALFASAMAGVPFVPLNYRLADAELRALVARCAPAILVADDAFAARVAGQTGITCLSPQDLFWLAGAAEPLSAARAESDDVALQLFTSGTTGAPKAALLRHRHLSTYVVETVEFMGAGDDDAQLVSVPPYHIAGVSSVLSAVYGGRRTVVLPAFSPEAWVDTAIQERITHAMLVPTMLGRVVAELESSGRNLAHMRHLSYGGGRMPQAVIEKAMRTLPHVDFVNAYGLTETSSTIAVLGPEDHRAAFTAQTAEGRRRLASVGRPLPNLEVSVRGAQGEAVAAGEAGEIWVRGGQVSGEYAGMKTIRDDGWLPTKDAGWIDGEGFLYVDGRLDDVIVRGGENISPGEIEEVLLRHGCVRDAAVIGLPDQEWGEKLVAAVVLRETTTAEQLQDWVRRHLRSAKTPERVVFCDDLPYNETGKLLRRVLKQRLAGVESLSR
ncbi:class I adenylate-forming enzyme family protein [Comamonadaceae bacterium G21597-S1]|nr:class I adenylate-forming enzyme family protein [Comamonadaceae bacterium G21597-S1]